MVKRPKTLARESRQGSGRVNLQGKFSVPFPLVWVEREIIRLKRSLRTIFLQYRRGKLSANECYIQGCVRIVETIEHINQFFKTYMAKHGVTFSEGSSEFAQVHTQALTQWENLTKDFSKNKPDLTAELLTASVSGFWLTSQGLLSRIDLFVQDFVYREINGSMYVVAVENGAYAMRWVTEQDGKVCKECTQHGTGGDHGYYLIGWFTPAPPPVHPNCRCTFEVIFHT